MNAARSEQPALADVPQQQDPSQVTEVMPLSEVFSGMVIGGRPSSGKSSGPMLIVVDGEVIATNTVAIGPERNLFQRVADDPYWLVMTLVIAVVALGVTVIGLIIDRIRQMVRMVAEWLSLDGISIPIGVIVLMSAVVMVAGGAVARCAGSHCRGCRGR